jgi:hypothetical protein
MSSKRLTVSPPSISCAVPYPLVLLSNHNMPRLDGPGLFSFVTEDPGLARRHAYVYMTAGNRVIPPPLVRQLEALSVPVLRSPSPSTT